MEESNSGSRYYTCSRKVIIVIPGNASKDDGRASSFYRHLEENFEEIQGKELNSEYTDSS